MRRPLISFATPLLSVVLLGARLQTASLPPVRGEHGMVVSAHALASQVGVDILKKGGNAVDAAVAVGFALAVVEPGAGNIGGGGFLVFHEAASGKNFTVDYRETAPQQAHRDMFLDGSGNVVPERSTVGHRAVGVPGTVAGLLLALEEHGRLVRQTVLEPAVRLAEEGFTVDANLVGSLEESASLLSRFPESRRIFLRNGNHFEEGEILVQKELAATLRLIAEHGASGFYEGRTAELLAEEMTRGGGLITLEDLKAYRALEREPVLGRYRDHTIVAMGPPSSGGIVLVEMLNMLEPEDLASLELNSSDYLHLLAEVMKRAYADRAQYLGDADFTSVPVRGLTSKAYAQSRRSGINPHRTTLASQLGAGDPFPHESDQTTHFSVVDREGNAVSNTYTLNGFYGSGVTVTGAGFLLNNEMDDFSSKPGVPNQFQLIQGEVNSIEAGKRPLSAMTPTIVLQDGRVLLVTGSPGGPRIINTVLQVILNVIDHRLGIQEAVDAPRFHHQWLPDVLFFERLGMVRDVRAALSAKGHTLTEMARIGTANSIFVAPTTQTRMGAGDPRREGKAVGY
ncbi:MAG: gamma-glutamyltransferase [Vicinamibacteria bacterium]